MHHPVIVILAAGAAGWIFGAIWYTVLGKPWQRALGLNPDDCKDKKMPMAPMVVSFLVAVVMSAVLYQLLTNLGVMGVMGSAIAGLTLGAGLLLTSTLVNNLFQGRSFILTVIDGGHWTLALAIESVVIALLS
jgi:uncharacterized protein DUF1761